MPRLVIGPVALLSRPPRFLAQIGRGAIWGFEPLAQALVPAVISDL